MDIIITILFTIFIIYLRVNYIIDCTMDRLIKMRVVFGSVDIDIEKLKRLIEETDRIIYTPYKYELALDLTKWTDRQIFKEEI